MVSKALQRYHDNRPLPGKMCAPLSLVDPILFYIFWFSVLSTTFPTIVIGCHCNSDKFSSRQPLDLGRLRSTCPDPATAPPSDVSHTSMRSQFGVPKVSQTAPLLAHTASIPTMIQPSESPTDCSSTPGVSTPSKLARRCLFFANPCSVGLRFWASYSTLTCFALHCRFLSLHDGSHMPPPSACHSFSGKEFSGHLSCHHPFPECFLTTTHFPAKNFLGRLSWRCPFLACFLVAFLCFAGCPFLPLFSLPMTICDDFLLQI